MYVDHHGWFGSYTNFSWSTRQDMPSFSLSSLSPSDKPHWLGALKAPSNRLGTGAYN